jgi:hypothetical protein
MIAKRTVVLRALVESSDVGRACRVAGIHHRTFYRWIKEDPRFAERVECAKKLGCSWPKADA